MTDPFAPTRPWLNTAGRLTTYAILKEIASMAKTNGTRGAREAQSPTPLRDRLYDLARRDCEGLSVVRTVLQRLYDTNTEGNNAELANALKLALERLDSVHEELDLLSGSVGKEQSDDDVAPVHEVDDGPLRIEGRPIRIVAEDLTDVSEGIFHLAGNVADGDAEKRMSGIRALSHRLDEQVAMLSRLADGAAS